MAVVYAPLSLILAEDVSSAGMFTTSCGFSFRVCHTEYFRIGRTEFEPERSRLSFGESLAIMVVVVSVALLGWELLYFFKSCP